MVMITVGRHVYGIGAVALGSVELAFGAFSADWVPVHPALPGYHLLLYGSAGLLILGGLVAQVPRIAAIGALALALFFAGWTLVLLLPHALADPATWVSWQGAAENVAMALGGVLAFAGTSGEGETKALAVARAARLAFGLCLLVFGISHFVYAGFTAALVPAWLPPSQLFWAYATGVAQLAAGLAMLSGVKARLAAILLTAMYVGFGLLVHLPSIIANPASHENWAENAINLLLIGAAWTLADSLAARSSAIRGS
jgi:uncharacterized membrane protein YphA (DoxX/SURF4 family)